MEYSIVMGATGGIGKEFCKALAKRGENLIISGRCKNKLELLKSELTKCYSVEILTYELDLIDSEKRQEFFNYVKNLGKINGLYYVSGIDTRKSFLKYQEDKIVMQSRVNFEGALSLTKFALENRSENLKILVVSSACGFQPMPYFSEYSATKSALIYFYKGLKKDM
jgi:short-subunit dehydrogenase